MGSELLRGKLNTHASHISRRLASIGLALNEETTVSDELNEITAAIRRALECFHVVIVSGGLGPTFDDLTREAASEATGLPLALSHSLLRGIQKKFRRARYRMPAANARQAYLLQDAEAIPNSVGTAPGQFLLLPPLWGKVGMGGPPTPALPHKGGGSCEQLLVLLPGPPNELYPMLDSFVLPRLKRLSAGQAHAEAHLHFVNVPESVIDDKVRPIIARYSIPHPSPSPFKGEGWGEGWSGSRVDFTILAHLGLVDLDIFVSSPSAPAARKTLARIVQSVKKAVGSPFYGMDEDYPLEKVVGDRLRSRRATLAVAESCTGGLLASRLTEVPGSSDYFVEGWVTYANASKVRELGVPEALVKKHGAVSEPVAKAMARGIRERAGSTWGIGITGVAGPGGGTPKKPVGLVYVGLSSAKSTIAQEFRFGGDRDAIRKRSVLAALDLLRRI